MSTEKESLEDRNLSSSFDSYSNLFDKYEIPEILIPTSHEIPSFTQDSIFHEKTQEAVNFLENNRIEENIVEDVSEEDLSKENSISEEKGFFGEEEKGEYEFASPDDVGLENEYESLHIIPEQVRSKADLHSEIGIPEYINKDSVEFNNKTEDLHVYSLDEVKELKLEGIEFTPTLLESLPPPAQDGLSFIKEDFDLYAKITEKQHELENKKKKGKSMFLVAWVFLIFAILGFFGLSALSFWAIMGGFYVIIMGSLRYNVKVFLMGAVTAALGVSAFF
jgi:hypothetical protein